MDRVFRLAKRLQGSGTQLFEQDCPENTAERRRGRKSWRVFARFVETYLDCSCVRAEQRVGAIASPYAAAQRDCARASALKP